MVSLNYESSFGWNNKFIIGLILGGTAREYEVPMATNIMSDHTDMQDKYCGDCYDIHSMWRPPLY